ncbi:1,4-dihydroxy-2-naphthoate polyprenyltransferase [Saprospiraceae bacterium]|nr:1,4-dihydroxy-2-naphthoate polyprenyltransferase [Saprospiraceae bacterium]MDB4539410.1 1,4-dihydroxy-2-naphthoate polyprenyltransferase [Saprospiraceae bacterium]MDB4768795.1 1,4-dihydroxy-2-naphthoate polyprenyltransferase [Saprospiraceae bacterium]MDG1434566.1 1,4-dihydroxy-2-naphthoate polyprenyltransferase [Saprospiraceae bacterium]
MVKAWLSAFRLRTLPLALASIGMGTFLAASFESMQPKVFLLSALTTIFLQILSNLANDYGDSIHGADSISRKGPQRAVQSGQISSKAMYVAIILFVFLSFTSGVWLLIEATNSWQTFGLFLILGILAIIASITYTAGSNPYGYIGLGDISVLIFFGWVAVLGTFYLHTQFIDWWIILPASSCGFFATAVLNLNNIRDIESDKLAGKNSLPVRMGKSSAIKYHWFLLIAGIVSAVAYVGFNFQNASQFLFLIVLPLLFVNGKAVYEKTEASQLDPYLKQMALTTLLFVITFGIGQII